MRVHRYRPPMQPLSEVRYILSECMKSEIFLTAAYLFEHCRNISNPENAMIAAIDISNRFSQDLTFGLLVQSELDPRLADACFLLAKHAGCKVLDSGREQVFWRYKKAARERVEFESKDGQWGIVYNCNDPRINPEAEVNRQIEILKKRWKDSENQLCEILCRVKAEFEHRKG